MLKVKVSAASGSLTLGVTGVLVVSSFVVMLALAAVGGFPGGCPVMTPTMIAIRAAREMSPSRNFWIAARIMLSMDWSPLIAGFARRRATDSYTKAAHCQSRGRYRNRRPLVPGRNGMAPARERYPAFAPRTSLTAAKT